jgi:hypothetical protein
VFYVHSAASQLDVAFDEFIACSDRFTTKVDSRYANYQGWRPSGVKLQQLSDAAPLLVAYHEREHFRELMSSPCGLLTWRVINGIATAIAFIVRKISESSAAETVRLPLRDWYVNGGRDALCADPPPPPPGQRERGYDATTYARDLLPYLDAVFGEIDVLTRFLDAFEERVDLTMREFVDLANTAFFWLSRRSELPLTLRWSAYDLDAPSYLPRDGVTFNEIIEAAARFWELQHLYDFGATDALIDEWRRQSIFGVYQPAFDFLRPALDDPWLCRVAIDVALTSPIDLACSTATTGVIHVEEILPSWRLPKIVQSMRDEFWPLERRGQELEVRRNIAARAGLPTPEAALAAALTHQISGPTAWSGDAAANAIDIETTTNEYFVTMEQEIRRGFQLRHDDALVFLDPDGTPEVFQPALELFHDIAFFHHTPAAQRSDLYHLKAYRAIVANLMLLSLLSDGDLSDLMALEKSFEARMVRILLHSASAVAHHWRIDDILRSSFTEPFRRLFRR